MQLFSRFASTGNCFFGQFPAQTGIPCSIRKNVGAQVITNRNFRLASRGTSSVSGSSYPQINPGHTKSVFAEIVLAVRIFGCLSHHVQNGGELRRKTSSSCTSSAMM